jgi:membrane protein YqaA with SNARE-associated domain
MAFELNLSSPLLAILSAGALGFVVGLVPIGLAEALALAIGAVMPPALSLTMLATFTAAHVLGKLPWYWLGRQAERVEHPRAKAFIARTREMLAHRSGYGAGLLAAAALASVPPFHLAAIAAGMVRFNLGAFLALCLAGRAVRFSILASVPSLLRALFA